MWASKANTTSQMCLHGSLWPTTWSVDSNYESVIDSAGFSSKHPKRASVFSFRELEFGVTVALLFLFGKLVFNHGLIRLKPFVS